MHMPNDKFSIAVEGSGKLLGMFVTKCMKRFPNATIYDRSNQFRSFAAQERTLGNSELASPEFRRSSADRGPDWSAPVDVTVTFQINVDKENDEKENDDKENVIVADKQSSRILTFDMAAAKHMHQVESFVHQVIQAVASAH
jgi:hypothetical protein